MEDESLGVELVERVLVEEALKAPDRGLGLRIAGNPFCEFGVADIFALEEWADHQDQEVPLVVAVLGEEGDKVQSEGVQKGVGRVLLSHDLARSVTPQKLSGTVVFACLEQFYKRKRRHSYLGYLSPAEFEARHPASLRRIA